MMKSDASNIRGKLNQIKSKRKKKEKKKGNQKKNHKKENPKESKKEKKKELVSSSPGQNMCLLSLPYS